MRALTIIVLIAVGGYCAYRVRQVWHEIWRFGSRMLVGVAAGLAAVALGQLAFVRGDRDLLAPMLAAGVLCFLLVISALRRGNLLR
jgi:hypothetical protein